MAAIHGNLTDETSDDINLNYRMINLSHEDDENEEGMAEYLDLELENVSVEDTADTDEYSNRGIGAAASNQSSVLKTNYNVKTSCVKDNERKSSSVKSTTRISSKNQTRTKYITANRNSSRRGTNKKIPKSYENVDVMTAVNEINANLANSTHFINDNASNEISNTRNFNHLDSSSKFEVTVPNTKTDLDGVDLFFQSMAQTVMSLPTSVQARVKMDICKIIAQAEMKHATKMNLSEVFYPS